MTRQQGDLLSDDDVRLAYESPKAPVGRHGSLVYLRDGDTLTVTGPHTDVLERRPRVKRVLGVALGAGVFMTVIGAAFGGVTIDLRPGSLGVRGNALGRVGIYVACASAAAIILAYLLLRRRRGRVTIEANRSGLTCRVQPHDGPEHIQRWRVEEIVDLGGDTDGGILLFLKDRRQVKLYLGRNYGESMHLTDELNRSLARPVAQVAPRQNGG